MYGIRIGFGNERYTVCRLERFIWVSYGVCKQPILTAAAAAGDTAILGDP